MTTATAKSNKFNNQNDNSARVSHLTVHFFAVTATLHLHHAFLYISFPSMHDYDVKLFET